MKSTTYRSRLVLHVTCDMLHAKCYKGLVTCYVKALLSMGKQGTKSFARDFSRGGTPYTFFKNKIFIEECILKWRNYELCLQ